MEHSPTSATGTGSGRRGVGDLWPNRPLRSSAKLPSNLNRIAGENQARCVEQDLMLRRPDLRLDDLDGEFFAAQQSGDTVPD